ncbi:hypothetical protein K2173_023961 [Erythroxylum novogranatense]|uniref:Small auxin up regulated protein n=1 Tax=Erythroxylum novogranatense TaxID=1862640 RepID=A0AAV8TPY9_9ROSI|nr:hypothetical protein K2173_023961 [Erythroxylum novogranatense]
MFRTKMLAEIARKFQRIATLKRKRLSIHRSNSNRNVASPNESSFAGRGQFVAYSIDEKRFVLPLAYLNKSIFRELLKISEEVFGLPREGPIRLPFHSEFMGYVLLLIQRGLSKDMENALLVSMETSCCSMLINFQKECTAAITCL